MTGVVGSFGLPMTGEGLGTSPSTTGVVGSFGLPITDEGLGTSPSTTGVVGPFVLPMTGEGLGTSPSTTGVVGGYQAITLAARRSASRAASIPRSPPNTSSVCWPGVGTGPTRPGVADIFTVTPGA